MVHGTTAYKKHGCRCRVCREAYSEYSRARRSKPRLPSSWSNWPVGPGNVINSEDERRNRAADWAYTDTPKGDGWSNFG